MFTDARERISRASVNISSTPSLVARSAIYLEVF